MPDKRRAHVTDGILNDIDLAVKTLSTYAEKGYLSSPTETRNEPETLSKPDSSRFKPLRKLESSKAKFVAVDCSTRVLKRANNWGVYLFRPAYAFVENRQVDWGFQERIKALVGPPYTRFQALRDLRLELESELALSLTSGVNSGDYLFLDGASYFGEQTGYNVSLYEKCKSKGISLLALSKQSPTLRDERGRDFQATAQLMAQQPLWVYHPVAKANLTEHLYGDIAVVKLCEESPRVFRLDIMEYLTGREASEVVSPLTAVSEDPRCLGYPVPLLLAHEFSATADSKMLYHFERIENLLKESGHYDRLSTEEQAGSFADSIHGVKFSFEREVIDYV